MFDDHISWKTRGTKRSSCLNQTLKLGLCQYNFHLQHQQLPNIQMSCGWDLSFVWCVLCCIPAQKIIQLYYNIMSFCLYWRDSTATYTIITFVTPVYWWLAYSQVRRITHKVEHQQLVMILIWHHTPRFTISILTNNVVKFTMQIQITTKYTQCIVIH